MTDKATGKPLAGILVEMTARRRGRGMPLHSPPMRTDAIGSPATREIPISRPSIHRGIPVI